MKLYVISKVTGYKTYVNVHANVRNDLRVRFSGDWFTIHDGYNYHVNEVYAEAETKVANTSAGAILGGIVGLLGGPLGLLIGAGIGAAVGNSSDNNEVQRTNTFNNSW
jgi:hypothetical protein